MPGSSACAGVVLAGGRSHRMGTAKAHLEWHGSTLLGRVVGVVGRAVGGPVVVVRGPGQPLPALPAGVEVRDDPVEGRGPLQGLAVGLAAVAERAEAAFACATDLPLLHPAFARAVLAGLGEDVEVALPDLDGHRQPLAAAYRTALVARVERLLAEGERGLAPLLSASAVRVLDAGALLADPALAAADPALDSLVNVNDPDGYRSARARPAPAVTVAIDGAPPRAVRAPTPEVAVRGSGWAFLRDGVEVDPRSALVDGDRLEARRRP